MTDQHITYYKLSQRHRGGKKYVDSLYAFDKILGYIYLVPETTIIKYDKRYVVLSYKEMRRLEKLNFKQIIKLFKHNSEKYKNKYIHISTQPLVDDEYLTNIINSNNSTFGPNSTYYNPEGLWVSCGADWINYVYNRMKEGSTMYKWSLATFIYEVLVNDTVLKINDDQAFYAFIHKYRNANKNNIRNIIDWVQVKKDYNGLIICPYLGDKIFGKDAIKMWIDGDITVISEYYKKLLGSKFNEDHMFLAEWYRHWEVGSGVIWNNAGIRDIVLLKRINTFDKYKVIE